MLGAWLTVAAGAWFVIGRALADLLGLGGAGTPVAATETKRVWLELTYFYGLGALVVFLGALAVGRLSVRSVRDVEYANRPLEGEEAVHSGPVDTESSTTDADARTESTERRDRRGGLRNMFRRRRDHDTLVHH